MMGSTPCDVVNDNSKYFTFMRTELVAPHTHLADNNYEGVHFHSHEGVEKLHGGTLSSYFI